MIDLLRPLLSGFAVASTNTGHDGARLYHDLLNYMTDRIPTQA
jgi:hypothetical protein